MDKTVWVFATTVAVTSIKYCACMSSAYLIRWVEHLSIHISPKYVFPAANMIIALELFKVMSNNIGPKYFNCTLCDTRVHTNNINKFNI